MERGRIKGLPKISRVPPIYAYAGVVTYNEEHWIPDEKRKRGRPRITWRDTVWRDVECMDITWQDVCHKATDREEWKAWTARCASHRKD